MQCSINSMPRMTTTTDECLARLQHSTGSNQGISGLAFLSGYFELVPYKIPEYFYVLLYSFLRISVGKYTHGRSQWPRGLRLGFAAARLLGLWDQISPGAWMSVCCECCALSGRGPCVGLIARTEESYRVWSV